MPMIYSSVGRSLLLVLVTLVGISSAGCAQQSRDPARILALFSEHIERDHVDFGHQAIKFFLEASRKEGFSFTSTTDWTALNPRNLARYDLVIWLNDSPHTAQQRKAFEDYMNHGGRWLGFHVSAYNDAETHWPWFVDFLGGAVFSGNSWPPLPATLVVENTKHPVVAHLPHSFEAPSNEWYLWRPSPRMNRDVEVLVTLSPTNYPIGLKDTVTAGDIPVVWTNTRFRMLYINMGHGDQIFSSEVQNKLFTNALRWLGSTSLEFTAGNATK
jgi:type 1 glutamine amidotransferase